MPFFDKQLKYVLVLCAAASSVGLVLAYYSPASSTLISYFGFNSFQTSAFNAIPSIFAIIGSPCVDFLVRKYGRKIPTIIIQSGVVFGWILIIATMKSYFWLSFIGRVVCGVSIGGLSALIPVYISELAPEDSKSSYGVLCQLSASFGTLLSYIFGYTNHWRWIAVLSLIPCAVFFIFIWFCPESPVVDQIKSQQPDPNNASLFQMKYIKPIITAALCVVFQQFSGINALLTNLTPIFNESHISLAPTTATVIVGLAQVIATTASSPIVAKFGNKICWIASTLGQAFFLLLLWANEQFNISPILPVLCLFLDVLMFGIGLGPIPWFVVVLLFPPHLCAFASSLTQGLNYLLCSIMIFTFNPMSDSMGIGWVYFFYSIIMVLATIYGFFLLPSCKKQENITTTSLVNSNEDANI